MATVTSMNAIKVDYPQVSCVPVADQQLWKAKTIALIGEPLKQVEDLIESTLSSSTNSFDAILKYVGQLSGKRLRPMLTLLSAIAIDGRSTEETIRQAAVVELVHTATLVHDDMLDQAERRRHSLTIHKKWDDTTAILCGDWLFTRAYGLANQGESTTPGRWISNAACRLCEGEILQNQAVGNWSLSEGKYIEILKGKTGNLCAVSCRLGAWTAAANQECCDALDAFGMDLGIAFQLHDDWLDYWGETETTGKPDHADLMASKPTLPMIYLFDQLPEDEQEHVREVLKWDRAPRIAAIHEYLERVNAELYIRRTAVRFAERAKTHLSALRPSLARDALATLADLSVARFA